MADYDGTPGNDKLTYPEHGTKDNDVYYGYEGNDTLDGGPGADVMYGGPSADHLHGDDINSETAAGTEVRVTVSGDAYQGQPEMRVLLGNEEIGRVHVTARHDIGEWQVLTFTAPGGVDAKQLRLEFVEDAYDEGIGDRNLWVAKVEANGKVFDALAGRLDPPQWSGDPEHAVLQEHGYVLPSKGALQFSLPPVTHSGLRILVSPNRASSWKFRTIPRSCKKPIRVRWLSSSKMPCASHIST